MTPEERQEVKDFLENLSENGIDSMDYMDRATGERLVLKSLVYLYNALKTKKNTSIIDDFIRLR